MADNNGKVRLPYLLLTRSEGVPATLKARLNTVGSGQVSIRLNGSSTLTSGGMTLKVVDVVGRDCFSRSSFAMTEVLDVGNWPDGLYVVMLTDGDGNRHTERLVVRH